MDYKIFSCIIRFCLLEMLFWFLGVFQVVGAPETWSASTAGSRNMWGVNRSLVLLSRGKTRSNINDDLPESSLGTFPSMALVPRKVQTKQKYDWFELSYVHWRNLGFLYPGSLLFFFNIISSSYHWSCIYRSILGKDGLLSLLSLLKWSWKIYYIFLYFCFLDVIIHSPQ